MTGIAIWLTFQRITKTQPLDRGKGKFLIKEVIVPEIFARMIFYGARVHIWTFSTRSIFHKTIIKKIDHQISQTSEENV